MLKRLKRELSTKQILLLFLIAETLFLFFLTYQAISSPGFYPGYKTYKANTNWRPIDLTKGTSFRGLNTIYTLKQNFKFQNISWYNFAFRAMKDNTPYWLNVTSGSNARVNIWQWFTKQSVVLELTSTGTYSFRLYVGSLGQPSHVSGVTSWSFNNPYLDFTATASSSQFIYVNWNSYSFTFHGVFNETSGKRIYDEAATVTAYFTDGTPPETFTVNGTYNYATTNALQYFTFDVPSTTTTITQYASNLIVYNGSNYYDVLFLQVEPDTNYNVQVTLTWNTTYTITNKATTGFRVNFATPPNTDEYLTWHVSRITKTTTQRQYWVSPNEYSGEIYIFTDELTTYTFSFLDLAGALDDYPFVEAKYYVNGTLHTVEKGKVDMEKKVQMNLVKGRKYYIVIQDGSSWTFGELSMTDQTVIQLTLKGIEFPQDIILSYRYVRIYATRQPENITVTYEDTLNKTNSVQLEFKFNNGTTAHSTMQNANSFVYVWSGAENDTDYYLVATIDHAQFGTLTWKQYFPRYFSEAPWGLGFLGNLPFDTSVIIPAIIIIFVAGAFSTLNAQVGAFFAVVTAAILTYLGWIDIPAGFLITAFAFAVMMAIIYAKRRVQV